MKFAVIVFPGSNCDHDAHYALTEVLGQQVSLVWHKEQDLKGADVVVLPGGFSYGDYLRTGAIAKFSPVMSRVTDFAAAGGPVIGICNGFQVLLETGLLPGGMRRNQTLKFICEHVHLRVEANDTPFTHDTTVGQILRIPIAHGEGRYQCSDETLCQLQDDDAIALRYVNNPNGSVADIAGITNKTGNVLGLMPHPERACDPVIGGVDGRGLLQSLLG